MNNFPNLSSQGCKIEKLLYENVTSGRLTYLARYNCKQVIVKHFAFAHPSSNWNGYKQIEREISYLQKLDHPQIAKYIDSFQLDSDFYLITEYIEGTPLNLQSFTSERAIAIILELLDLLIYLQSQSPAIVHRDIKPENIIIAPDGKPHLIDFGLAGIGVATANGQKTTLDV